MRPEVFWINISMVPGPYNKMINCDKCNKAVNEGEGRKHNSKTLCEDCYIDELMPRMPKAHYDNDAEFMQRLQDSYSLHPQKFH